jgi:hypothetical protein
MDGNALPTWAVNSMADAVMKNDMKQNKYALGSQTGTFADKNTQAAFEEWLARDAWGAFKREFEEKGKRAE